MAKYAKMPASLYALKNPKGVILWNTINVAKKDIWFNGGFGAVSAEQGNDWVKQFWKELNASVLSAKQLGYKFVKVQIKEKRS